MSIQPVTIDIGVTVAAATSESSDDPLVFTFDSQSPCLDNQQGDITLPANLRQVLITFHLNTRQIIWKKGKYPGTFNVSFDLGVDQAGAPTTAEDTLWLWPDTIKKIKSSPNVFSLTRMVPGSSNMAISTTDANNDATLYHYGVAVGISIPANGTTRPSSATVVCRNDPRIKNGGVGLQVPIRLVLAVSAAIIVTAIVLLAALGRLG